MCRFAKQQGQWGCSWVSWAKSNRSGVKREQGGQIMQTLSDLPDRLWIPLWVSGFLGNTITTTWQISKLSAIPTEKSGGVPLLPCLGLYDCQETRCYCLKNILQLSLCPFWFPAIMKPPKQHRMKTNMGKYAMKKVFNLLKYIFGEKCMKRRYNIF